MGSYQLVPTWGNKLTDLVLLHSSLFTVKKKKEENFHLRALLK